MKFSIYYVSDRTAITAEVFGKTLLSQFEAIDFKEVTSRFIDSTKKAQLLKSEIDSDDYDNKPIIFSTLLNPELRHILEQSDCFFFDLFNLGIEKLESIFNTKASFNVGLAHGRAQDSKYEQRMDAVNFVLLHDDGISLEHYDKADIILTGLSRSGKTPTCLYLALHYGIYAANYPLTNETLSTKKLPAILQIHHERVFALTIQAQRLQQIRDSRLPNSQYASLNQCKIEISQAMKLFKKTEFPILDVTSCSVEEIATTVLQFYNSNKKPH